MYIRREVFDRVGYFDERSFPRGYGEENDLCMRARAAGMVHLIDDATFVYHQRSASFGVERKQLIAHARDTLSRLHPTYKALVQGFLADPALIPLRTQTGEALREGPATVERILSPKPTVVFVLHAGGGGTPHTNADLMRSLSNQYDCRLLRCELGGWTLERGDGSGTVLRQWTFTDRWNAQEESLGLERRQALQEALSDAALVHVRSLVALAPEALCEIKVMGVPIVVSFHDFYAVCPTIQLLDQSRRYCAGHCTPGAGQCELSSTWFRTPIADLKHAYVQRWRERMTDGLRCADAFVTTSRAASDVIIDHFPFVADSLRIIPHGRDSAGAHPVSSLPAPDERQRVVVLGALGYSKGIELIDEGLRLDAAHGPRFAFHIVGHKHGRWNPESQGAFVHGPYQRDALVRSLGPIRPSYALVASL